MRTSGVAIASAKASDIANDSLNTNLLIYVQLGEPNHLWSTYYPLTIDFYSATDITTVSMSLKS